MAIPRSLSLEDWDARYEALRREGMGEPWYGGPLRRHLEAGGDTRLGALRFDDSPAALRLWNFLLTEEDRLREARAAGQKLVGAMKDLGTVPVLASAFPELTTFYIDGAWWIPCLMGAAIGALREADRLGVCDSFCPVRALLGAFVTGEHFPIPDLLVCSAGATCDDLSAVAQRVEGLGHPVFWWEMPHRRRADRGEPSATLPGGGIAPAEQVALVRDELGRVMGALCDLAGHRPESDALGGAIAQANRVRRTLGHLRTLAYTSPLCPMPALEMLICEMLAIHFCSDRGECIEVLADMISEVESRVAEGVGVLGEEAVRVFWVNPVADLRVMNLLEICGGRLCGTEFLFSHALDAIPEDVEPMEALARAALADPMVGTCGERAERISRDLTRFGAEALVISRVPGASHCAFEGELVGREVAARCGVPVLEIEVPSLDDAVEPALRTRLEALIETARVKRKRAGAPRRTRWA